MLQPACLPACLPAGPATPPTPRRCACVRAVIYLVITDRPHMWDPPQKDWWGFEFVRSIGHRRGLPFLLSTNLNQILPNSLSVKMSKPWESDNEGDEDDEVEYDEYERFNADHIIFLVDARSTMLELNASGESHLQDCLKVILYILKAKIIARDNSAIGLIFLGTGKSHLDKHYVEFIELTPPSAASVSKIQHLLDNFDEEFDRVLGGSQQINTASGGATTGITSDYLPLKDALQRCSMTFSRKASSNKLKPNMRRIWVFTNDDNPNSTGPNSTEYQNAMVTVARDVFNDGARISLWCMDRSNQQPFDVYRFYNRMLLLDMDTSKHDNGQPVYDDEDDDDYYEEELSDRIVHASEEGFDVHNYNMRSKFHKKRALFQGLIDFGLERLGYVSPTPTATADSRDGSANQESTQYSPGRIAVQFFSDLKIAKKPSPIKLWAENNEPLKTTRTYLRKDTGGEVPDRDITTFVAFTNENMPLVPMTRKDISELRAPPMFMPIQSLCRNQSSSSGEREMEMGSGCDTALEQRLGFSAQHRASASESYIFSKIGGGGVNGDLPSAQRAQIQGTSSSSSSSPSYASAPASIAELPFVALEVLYYAPKSVLPLELNLKEPMFIFPHEKAIMGSTVLFTAVLTDLHSKELLAMARYNGRDGTKEPRLVALLPVLHVGQQAAGMQMVILPFRNEVRTSPQPLSTSVLQALDRTPQLVQRATAIIRAMSLNKGGEWVAGASPKASASASASISAHFDTERAEEAEAQKFDYQNVESPALQQFYAVLQAVALRESSYSWNQHTQDMMLPSTNSNNSLALAAAIRDFKEELNIPEEATNMALGKRPSGGTGPNSKAVKKARADEVSTDDIRRILAVVSDEDQVNNYKVDALKGFCKILNLGVAGKKSELVEKLINGALAMLKQRGEE